MKIPFFLFFSFLLFSSLKAQSLVDAGYWFEKYEYSKSAELYSACNQVKVLSNENMKRLAYSYYAIGDYTNSMEILDTIITWTGIDPFFYYMHGEVNYAMMNFEQAKQSYLKINPIPEDFENEYNVSLKIAACSQMKQKTPQDYLKFEQIKSNTTKADINGSFIKNKKIIYQEKGKDSLGNLVKTSQLDSAELFLLSPYFAGPDGSLTQINVIDSLPESNFENISINSIAYSPLNDLVYVSFSQPLRKKATNKLSQIYEGVFTKDYSSITLLRPWKYSGYEDSTSCAHVSISKNGRFFLFSKIGDSTDGSDIYMSVFNNNDSSDWSIPFSLNVLNSPYNEMYPMFCGDSLITFSCNNPFGYGGLDIYKSKFNQGNYEKPIHLGYPFNSFKDDFNYNYLSLDTVMFSSNRKGTGDDDVYYLKLCREDTLLVLNDNDSIFDLKDLKKEMDDVFLSEWKNKDIYFDFDSDKVNKSELEISKLVEFLSEHPDSKVFLEGHTDSRGSDTYNLDLGMRRAQNTRDYLVSMNISINQITMKSTGEKNPPVDCKRTCSQKDHAKNRVVFIRLQQ